MNWEVALDKLEEDSLSKLRVEAMVLEEGLLEEGKV